MSTTFKDPFEGTPKAATHREFGVDNSSPLEKARRGTIYEDNGLYGMKDIDGVILYPAEYSFIGRCQDHVLFLKPDGTYRKLSPGCNESGYMQKEDRPYVKNGKAGFKLGRKVIIPAEYEYIKPTFRNNFTIFSVVKDGRDYYINDEGKEVLTRVKRFEGEIPHGSPFWLCSNCDDFYTGLRYVGQKDDSNPNVVSINGEWIELDRYCWNDILPMIINPDDDLALERKDTGTLLDSFSYERSFYFAGASGPDALETCLSQFEKMGAFGNSWHYTMKIWQAPGEYLPAKQIREFYRSIGGKRSIGAPIFSIGHSDSLNPGEVKVFLATNYNERCFPPQWEFDWFDKRDSLSITELKKEVPALRATVEKDIMKEYIEDDFHGLVASCLKKLRYDKGYNWELTREALDYFKEVGSDVKDVLCIYASNALETARKEQIDEAEYFLRAALWALENDSYVNVTGKSKTVLDFVNELHDLGLKGNAGLLTEELRTKLLEKGAMTYEDRLANEDYFKELDLLRGI